MGNGRVDGDVNREWGCEWGDEGVNGEWGSEWGKYCINGEEQ